MPEPPSPLTDLVRLDRRDPGVYERELDRTWWGHDAQFGGYVEALALTAMRAELDDAAMSPATVSVHFFRPFIEGPFRVEVEVVRRGRTMANLRAALHSGGRLAGQAIASFARRRAHHEMRAVVPPEALADPIRPGETEHPSQLSIPTHERFRFYPRLGGFAMGSGGGGLDGRDVGGWVVPRFEAPVDELLMVMLQDLWLPSIYHLWRQPAVAVSVDITTQFRGELPSAVRAADGLFVLLRSAGSLGGLVDEDCEIWTPGGELLAQGRQMRFVH